MRDKLRNCEGLVSENSNLTKSIRNLILIALGSLSLVLGILGIFIPLLPTTPFLLLSAALYARSSERFYHWLLNNKWLGRYIRDYREGRGVPLGVKIVSINLLWITIGYAAFYLIDPIWLKILLLFIALIVSIHILFLPTRER